MDLKLDADELNTCVQCGLCLPHCPTFRVTGDETMSPRGRIALMRHVQDNDAPVTDEVVDAFATCVQCRGCEPACPSAVPYGHLIEQTRETLVDMGKLTPKWQQAALKPLASPKLLRAGSAALAVINKTGLLPERLGLPDKLPIRQEPLVASGDDVWMFTGCVMDAWQRDVHQATQRVIEAAGFGVRPTSDAAPCCGALQSHAGMGDEARKLARKTIAALGDKPILVNSAGCGAAMKEYGHLLGTEEARAFSGRVYDVSEFLADHVDKFRIHVICVMSSVSTRQPVSCFGLSCESWLSSKTTACVAGQAVPTQCCNRSWPARFVIARSKRSIVTLPTRSPAPTPAVPCIWPPPVSPRFIP